MAPIRVMDAPEYIARSMFQEIEELASLAQRMSENVHTVDLIWGLVPKIENYVSHLKNLAQEAKETQA